MSPDAAWAARAAWTLAPEHCAPTCRSYHRLWPTMRLLGLGAGPERHRTLFAAAIARAGAQHPAPDLLVSGTADHAMVRLALEVAGPHATITALDRCPTPLAIVDAHADLVGAGARVRTVVGDALHPPPAGPFDLILTHSFLSQVTEAERQVLFRRWSDALRPGGAVVTNTRLAAVSHDAFDPARASALAREVAERLERIEPKLLPAPVPDLLAEVAGYAAAVAIHPVTDPAEIEAAVQAAGLVLDRLDRVDVVGTAGTEAGPGTAQPAAYLELVAIKP